MRSEVFSYHMNETCEECELGKSFTVYLSANPYEKTSAHVCLLITLVFQNVALNAGKLDLITCIASDTTKSISLEMS